MTVAAGAAEVNPYSSIAGFDRVRAMRGIGVFVPVVMGLWVTAWAADVPGTATIAYVKDGDSLVRAGGGDIRLVDINAPEGPHDGLTAEPFAEAARARVRELALGKTVRLEPAPHPTDKYGRLLAEVYLPDGRWLQGLLVQEGLAEVYTFADNAVRPAELLKLEAQARAARRGIWSLPRWQVKDADTCCAPDFIGLFQLVRGKVLASGQGKEMMYLNFGPDRHRDFTIAIPRTDLKYFKKAGIDPVNNYKGKTVLAHGFIAPIEGVEMRVTHPAQIEVLD
jgi:endonuclease YncB( thermonuclease family)